MSDAEELNEHGNHQGQFTQGVGGWAEYTVRMTRTLDTVRHDVIVPPGKVIPIIFLPGVMGSNLHMSRARQDRLQRPDNRAWRPDDMVTNAGMAGAATGNGLAGWFKKATPAQRQLIFDPNETEVDYYYYTESRERFDPDGRQTRESDARHQNVPNGLNAIPPLLGSVQFTSGAPDKRHRHSPAQIARWRGWSEVMFDGPYGDVLKRTESMMNNIVEKGKAHAFWQAKPVDPRTGKAVTTIHHTVSSLLMGDPRGFGAASGPLISEADLMRIAPCWYPVHAMGYNFIKSNGESAKVIAERIRGLVKGYQQRGFKCDEVIIVTHSMGGLLARALIHPSYGNMLNDPAVKILGMYHNVMPTLGAAGAYKRMRFGFQEREGYTNEIQAKIFGINGQHATAILANAPAPLEMMPAAAYGQGWLRVVSVGNRALKSWPTGTETALDSIYLKPEKAWWRLIQPSWVNPGDVAVGNGGGIKNVFERIKNANQFLQSIEKTFHPNTYASYCASALHPSYGEVTFRITAGSTDEEGRERVLPPPESWILLNDNAKDTLTVQAGKHVLTLRLEAANAAGDETVPSERSARHIVGKLFVHGQQGDGYEHQSSYADPQVQASLLYAMVQIAKTAKWN